MIRRLLLAPLLVLCTPAAAQQQPLPADQAALKAHVQFLASDALKGREAGTAEFDIAAEYVAAQMEGAGLKPAGDKGWFQPVRLLNYRAADKGTASVGIGATQVPLIFGKDYIRIPTPAQPTMAITAPVVFAGYGLIYPQGRIDDYAGLDVRGKIVAVLAGLPEGLPNEVDAHFSGADEKAALASARGAKGMIVLESAARQAEQPFDSVVPYWEYNYVGWARPDSVANAPTAPRIGYFSNAGAQRLFTGARIKWSDVLAAERRGSRIPRGNLAVTLSMTGKTELKPVETRNVIGMLEGSDPALKSQHVVLSAHLDHVGIGEPVKGDAIYNGAMDNAIGVASILEVARSFQASGKRPRRSLLFVALSAEEKGLLGSERFAAFPSVPKGSLIADINLDMPILTYPLQDLVVLGGERSTLGQTYAQVAATEGLKTVPDPSPEEMFFIRSDHYSFVKAGIPAVSIDSGPGGAGAAAQRVFLDNHYHQPSDQIDLPIDWASAAKFTRVNIAAVRAIADAEERPRWNKGDFFGVQFQGYGAK